MHRQGSPSKLLKDTFVRKRCSRQIFSWHVWGLSLAIPSLCLRYCRSLQRRMADSTKSLILNGLGINSEACAAVASRTCSASL